MLEQTKETRDTLLSCGLKLNEFSVRSEAIHNHGEFICHGEVKITFLCSFERQREVAPKLAAHFHVVQFRANRVFLRGLNLFEGTGYIINDLYKSPGITVVVPGYEQTPKGKIEYRDGAPLS